MLESFGKVPDVVHSRRVTHPSRALEISHTIIVILVATPAEIVVGMESAPEKNSAVVTLAVLRPEPIGIMVSLISDAPDASVLSPEKF